MTEADKKQWAVEALRQKQEELGRTPKKDDFDAQKAEHEYQVKLQHGLERERERQAKRAEMPHKFAQSEYERRD